MPSPIPPSDTSEGDHQAVDLQGKLCPFAVMCVIKGVDEMREGEEKTFLFDDPLATKSIPEELGEYDDIDYKITKKGKGWEIFIKKG